jgi:hypothetical protein
MQQEVRRLAAQPTAALALWAQAVLEERAMAVAVAVGKTLVLAAWAVLAALRVAAVPAAAAGHRQVGREVLVGGARSGYTSGKLFGIGGSLWPVPRFVT